MFYVSVKNYSNSYSFIYKEMLTNNNVSPLQEQEIMKGVNKVQTIGVKYQR